MDFFYLTALEREAVTLSLQVAGWAVVLSLPVGIFTAWALARGRFPGKSILEALVHLPLVLPPVVMGYLLLVLLGRNGIIGGALYRYLGITLAFTWKGAVLAAAVMAFPLLVRAVRLSLESVDPGLEAAARTLGAGPMRVFFTVTLPLMAPGILTGTLLAFARSLGEFGATITFVSNIRGETQTLPLALYTLTQVPDGETGAMRLCILSVLIAMVALIISETLSRQVDARMKA
ncbi:molybdate ABC transporter permease subunit [Desulfoluna spongiiphila]|uniref:Molybdenum transport system permease n=1 Tax=Desulfoluna spongiiphila TaxID=419481 RepID=A0A1G5JJA7_9BACT|nr:molybdate ABC transporter permease subunit [Desulfoluna spongiiphila]SCY88463.1 molybdate transport system permease protein [Desulfoluna spongiiphila]VVS92766.1 molybdate abc transporter permease protein [Desulfoluna spongiiphila]